MIRFIIEVLVVVLLVQVFFMKIDNQDLAAYVGAHGVGPTLERVWNGPKK